MKFFIETHGCAAAQSDSELIAGLLSQKHISSDLENADVIIIVTCDVKLVTEQKITNRAVLLGKKYSDKRLVLVGCMVDNRHSKLRKLLPNASFVGTHRIMDIEQALTARVFLLDGDNSEKICLPRVRRDAKIGIVQISEGCRGNCYFCSTRLAKGVVHSFPMERIVEDVTALVNDGCEKIHLTSQDTGAYGYDLVSKSLLPELLTRISQIEGKFVVRVGMMNPDNVLPCLAELIKAYQSEKIQKFLHLPVQSGSDKVLKDMNRRYSLAQFNQIVDAFRVAYPDLYLCTDVIVGYPRETEDEFQETLKFLETIKPNFTNVSRFARREGTKAAKMKQFDTKEMKRRTRICSKLVKKISSVMV
jgi:threonylcarbamoyladenosine tRNA methylthiotransferase CDKAL1